jgi:ribosomal protein S18 acetylase RimI-like enzyme
MKVERIYLNNCDKLTNLHLKAFPNFFLSSLGYNFLKIFYSTIIKNDNSILKGIFEDNELVAFAIGSKKSNFFYSNLLINNFFEFGFVLAPILITSPIKIVRLIKSFVSFNGNKDESSNAILLSIGVDPDKQGQGLGKIVLKEFENDAFYFNDTIILTTDKLNNSNVNSFYLSNGYILLKTFYQGNRPMNCYYKNKH